ncbi:MAG: hypothetical protein ACI82F_002188 [Planctomycetota bacterium]|jgi:hypothetical protein
MLDCHPRMRCFGEVLRLKAALEEGLPCSCGLPMEECKEWQAARPHLAQEKEHDLRAMKFGHFRALAQARDVDVAIDLSKTLVWRHARKWGKHGAGYILLLRDTRGVLAAAQRAGIDVQSRIARHAKWIQRQARMADKLGDKALVVRYEDLCGATEAELRRISKFIGIEFDEAMLRPADQEHHFVHSSRSKYMKGSNSFRLDQRWKTELEPGLLREIEGTMSKVPLLASYL